ncbi:Atr10 [Stachybotrys chlorohalonatus IBT 40285]|uniref:Short-chain dehydrogenase/reductase ATR10 n=1 Tax=Stachybotrys chlorohalonatus (strain IBT 40285) TaxID=1283841 RepID=ATR10_STAC4|nr:RecName: Full=Short-chain dehydrogenase/reductase ATR10; AltName: Full=Core atranone cluster (CAC) protein 10 [Stachybotrys chlorohalonata IBT 40285]KFA70069.1 Atr10 [Stachybotrys chlorohalonata IBT 40285]
MARQSAEPPTDDGQSAKEIVVITGGNTGIGFEVARQLLCNYGNRFYVIIGSRTLGKGHTAVAALKQQGYEAVQAVQLDVTKEASIAAAAKIIGEQFGRIDVLHVNAGVLLEPTDINAKPVPFSETIMETMRTNVAGAAATVEGFTPLLSIGSNPRVVFMTSTAASAQLMHQYSSMTTAPALSASKAAENIIMIYYYHKYPNWKVNACYPGYRDTAMMRRYNASSLSKAYRQPDPVEEGAYNAVRLSLLGKDGETGTFTEYKGVGEDGQRQYSALPW